MERGVSRPAVARRQFDFAYMSQESQQTASAPYTSASGNNALHPVGAFIDRQAMLEYQNADTQDLPTSPLLLPVIRIGNVAPIMTGEDSFAPNHIVPFVLVPSILFMNDLFPPFLQHSPAFLTDTSPETD